jgi:ATP-dependent RNA helicase RhlE
MDTLTSFDSLNLPIPVKKALEHSNITVPTEIQAQAIPHALSGRDVIGLAQTGTVKTLAFCLPIVDQMDINGDNGDCALILTPTREIAIQVTEVLKHLTLKMTGRWHPVLVIGGVGMQPQIDGLKKSPRFIVATPGRLLDHMQEGHAQPFANGTQFIAHPAA